MPEAASSQSLGQANSLGTRGGLVHQQPQPQAPGTAAIPQHFQPPYPPGRMISEPPHGLPMNARMDPRQQQGALRPQPFSLASQNSPEPFPQNSPSWAQKVEDRLTQLEEQLRAERTRQERFTWGLRAHLQVLRSKVDETNAKMAATLKLLEDKQNEQDSVTNFQKKWDDQGRQMNARLDEMEAKLTHGMWNSKNLEAEMANETWKKEMEHRQQTQVELFAEIIKRCLGLEAAAILSEKEEERIAAQSTTKQMVLPDEEDEEKGEEEEADTTLEQKTDVGDEWNLFGKMSTSPQKHLPEISVMPAAEELLVTKYWPYPSRSTGKRAPKTTPASKQRFQVEEEPGSVGFSSATGSDAASPVTSNDKTTSLSFAEDVAKSSASNTLPAPSPSRHEARSCLKTQAGIVADKNNPSSSHSRREDGSSGPVFYFSKHPDTVRQQWDEYVHGLDGQPAVRYLDSKYDTRWRKSDYARNWYRRRKLFWAYVRDLIEKGGNEEAALAEVEEIKGTDSIAEFIDRLERREVSETVDPAIMAAERAARLASRKRRRADVIVSDEEDSDYDGERGCEQVAKRTRTMELRGRVIWP